MKIDWSPAFPRAFACPLCHARAAKPSVLAVESPFREQGWLRLYACGDCGTLSFPELAPPDYEHGAVECGKMSDDAWAAIKFYIEQGAAPDTMAEPLFWVERQDVKRYAEVGCGFGFGLDFAREMMGWDVRGFDPSPSARAGRALLDLPITSDYLGPETWQGEAPFDMLLASEVIEHVSDPHRFLDEITPALAPDGWLVLSTPNAEAVRPDAGLGTLLPILTPGYHLLLFSAAGLRRLLETHGFTQIELRVSPTNLTVLANRCSRPCDLTRVLDRRIYREYLKRRLERLDRNEPLAHGLLGRLVKELTNVGDLVGAASELAVLTQCYRHCYGIDLDRPEKVMVEPIPTQDFTRLAARFPANLCGLAYRRAFIILHQDQDPAGALPHFELGERAGLVLRRALQGIGADDGETEHLVGLCRLGVLEARLRHDPSAAQRWLAATHAVFAGDGVDLASARRQCDETVERCFVDFVLSGRYAEAQILADARGAELRVDQALAARSLLARGLLTLNHRGDALSALRWFSHARRARGPDAGTGGACDEELTWMAETGFRLSQAVVAPADAARACLASLGGDSPPAPRLLRLASEVFQRLAHTASYDAAATLAPMIERRWDEAPEIRSAGLAFALGILALNHGRGPAVARDWFGQAAALATPGTSLADEAAAHVQLTMKIIKQTGHPDILVSEPRSSLSEGILFIVSAPSGAGKTSLVKALLERDPSLSLSVSCTTRSPRAGERDGVHYHFIDQERFRQSIAAGDFLEHAEVFGNLYGTREADVRTSLSAGRDLILEIDWQGARQVRECFGSAVGIFILPPSIAELEHRLRARGTDSDSVIAARMAQAREEMGHVEEYDYVLINDDFEAALEALASVIVAERHRLARQRSRWAELLADRG